MRNIKLYLERGRRGGCSREGKGSDDKSSKGGGNARTMKEEGDTIVEIWGLFLFFSYFFFFFFDAFYCLVFVYCFNLFCFNFPRMKGTLFYVYVISVSI